MILLAFLQLMGLYRELDNAALSGYLDRLANRLRMGEQRSIKVLEDGEPLAFAFPDAIYISTAEIRRHSSEHDLALTLAHLVAHSRLGHFASGGVILPCRSSGPVPLGWQARHREREREASAEAERSMRAIDWTDSGEFGELKAALEPPPRRKPSLFRGR